MGFVIDPQVSWVVGMGEVLVLAPGDKSPSSLRGSASDIWQTLAREAEEEKILASLSEQYGLETTVIEDDVREFIRGLVEKGLIFHENIRGKSRY